jgi:hypothetical protein
VKMSRSWSTKIDSSKRKSSILEVSSSNDTIDLASSRSFLALVGLVGVLIYGFFLSS